MLGHDDFKATGGWLSRWKCKFGIKFKKAHDEKDSADAVSAKQWKSTKLPSFRNMAQMIYTMPMKQVDFILPRRTVH
jgi:hypothetical protein